MITHGIGHSGSVVAHGDVADFVQVSVTLPSISVTPTSGSFLEGTAAGTVVAAITFDTGGDPGATFTTTGNWERSGNNMVFSTDLLTADAGPLTVRLSNSLAFDEATYTLAVDPIVVAPDITITPSTVSIAAGTSAGTSVANITLDDGNDPNVTYAFTPNIFQVVGNEVRLLADAVTGNTGLVSVTPSNSAGAGTTRQIDLTVFDATQLTPAVDGINVDALAPAQTLDPLAVTPAVNSLKVENA